MNYVELSYPIYLTNGLTPTIYELTRQDKFLFATNILAKSMV